MNKKELFDEIEEKIFSKFPKDYKFSKEEVKEFIFGFFQGAEIAIKKAFKKLEIKKEWNSI